MKNFKMSVYKVPLMLAVSLAGCVAQPSPDNNVPSDRGAVAATASSKLQEEAVKQQEPVIQRQAMIRKDAGSPENPVTDKGATGVELVSSTDLVADQATEQTTVQTSEQAIDQTINIDPVSDEQTRLTRRSDFTDGEPRTFTLTGSFSQGGLLFGQTRPGASVRLDGKQVKVDEAGRFVVGFGRDSDLTALLLVTQADGSVERHTIEIADKKFKEERINGLDQSKVSGYTKEQLEKIGIDRELKQKARSRTQDGADFVDGFQWPLIGRISGEFGSRRILNGEPKRPHSGVDIARPTGTPIRAPAGGIITLAKSGMYFEGGLVLLDHGHWLESAFLHMSRIDVEPGQRVEKGEIIGAVGATGRVTGPHLHWSMRWTGRLLDPQLVVGEMPSRLDE